MTRSLLSAVLFLALRAVALAQGPASETVVGTLTTVAAGTIDVKTREGKEVTVALAEGFELFLLERGKEVPASRDDIQVGRRVVVDVVRTADQLTATRVVLGVASPPEEMPPGKMETGPTDHGKMKAGPMDHGKMKAGPMAPGKMGAEAMDHGKMEAEDETSAAPALLRVVDAYRAALEERRIEDLEQVVTPDLLVLEGVHKNVGWPDYRDNHIGPEMKEWKRFDVLDVKTLEARIVGSFGYVVQESAYRIVTAEGPIELSAAETFVLRNSAVGWRIQHLHYSGKRKTSPTSGAKP